LFRRDKDKVKCDNCGYVLVKPYPKDKFCPKCGKFLKNLFEYGFEEEGASKPQPKEFETKNETASSKFKGKVRVKDREDYFNLEDDKIEFKDGNDYIKLLGITSVDRTPLFCSNQKYVYLLELTNNLDYIATSILELYVRRVHICSE